MESQVNTIHNPITNNQQINQQNNANPVYFGVSSEKYSMFFWYKINFFYLFKLNIIIQNFLFKNIIKNIN